MSEFNNSFLLACNKEKSGNIPVWFMRQAGRYQSAYRELRSKYTIKDICKIPEVCYNVTMLPVKQFNLDAAILFSDIMIPLEPMGVDFDYKPGVGPVLKNPVRTFLDVEQLRKVHVQDQLGFTGASLKALKSDLNIPCIGFIGAPFTLASYMIEGGPSKNYRFLKTFMYTQKDAWDLLMRKLTDMLSEYSVFQVNSGASAIQIFDSWIGCLDAEDYKEYVYPHMQRLMLDIKSKTSCPVIMFGVNTFHLFPLMKDMSCDVLGVDWRHDIFDVWEKQIDYKKAIQGNLDPTLLFADWSVVKNKANQILSKVKDPGFIFNLGHGILPGTPEDNVKRLADLVHEYRPYE